MTAEEMKSELMTMAGQTAVEMTQKMPDASDDFKFGFYEGMVKMSELMAMTVAKYIEITTRSRQ